VAIAIDILVEAGDWPGEEALRRSAERAVGAAESALGPEAPAGELSLVFTDDVHIRRLNAQYRGQDKATNVLSFPLGKGELLGDVILSAETVAREAAIAEIALEDHMAHLLIHGFLHLLGYDHEAEADAERMEELERAALGRIGVADPYAGARER
jgi:probable rRNA maturation factor